MGSSSMPGGSTPVSSANMMSGQFIGKKISLSLSGFLFCCFFFKKKGRSQLFFLVLALICGLISCGLPFPDL